MSIVKQARKALAKTQADFAEHMGVNKSTVVRWEKGGELPGPVAAYAETVVAWYEYQAAAMEWHSFPVASAQARVDAARARFLAAMGASRGE